MDKRAKIAASLLATLQDLCNQQAPTGEQVPPMPAEIFDRYVALLKLTLQWLGFVGSDEEFTEIAERAGLGKYLEQLRLAKGGNEPPASQSYAPNQGAA